MAVPKHGRPEEHAGSAVLFAAAVLLWLLNHPYQGIWHDARIYGLLAAHWLTPDALAPDLFFRFGSQGELSLFTPFYGALVGWLGLDQASWWVVLTGGIAWVAAMMLLANRMLGRGAAAGLAVLLAAVVTVSYSPNAGTFVLTENYATARSWALPLGLGGVAALVSGRRIWAFSLAMASLLLHPLLGIWPVALCLLVWLRTGIAVTLVMLVVIAAAAAGLLDIEVPHLRLMRGEWLVFARDVAPDILFRPAGARLVEHGAALAGLLLAAHRGSERCRPIYGRALLLGGGGLALAMIASFWLPIEILVQGQPWRVGWLLLPLAMLGLLDVAQRLGRESRNGPLLLGAAGAVAAMGPTWWLPALYLAAAGAFLPLAAWRRLDDWAGQRRKYLAVALGLVWLLLLPGLVADWDIAGHQLLRPWWTGAEWLHGLVAGGVWHIAALAAVPAVRGLPPSSASWRMAAACVLLGLNLFVLSQWDRRVESRRAEEMCYLERHCPAHAFLREIAVGETVFWPERELTVWFTLNRASYYGEVQRTGAVFSRAKFDEWRRRDALVAAAAEPWQPCADPALDWLVLGGGVAGASPRAVWRKAGLYACADFRAVSPASTLPRRGPAQ